LVHHLDWGLGKSDILGYYTNYTYCYYGLVAIEKNVELAEETYKVYYDVSTRLILAQNRPTNAPTLITQFHVLCRS